MLYVLSSTLGFASTGGKYILISPPFWNLKHYLLWLTVQSFQFSSIKFWNVHSLFTINISKIKHACVLVFLEQYNMWPSIPKPGTCKLEFDMLSVMLKTAPRFSQWESGNSLERIFVATMFRGEKSKIHFKLYI